MYTEIILKLKVFGTQRVIGWRAFRGRYWNYDLLDPVRAWPDNGTFLTVPKRYQNGPCAGQTGLCRFQADDRRYDENRDLLDLMVGQNKM